MKCRRESHLRCSSIVLVHNDLQDIRGTRVEWRVEVTELERRRVRSQPLQQAGSLCVDYYCAYLARLRVAAGFSARTG